MLVKQSIQIYPNLETMQFFSFSEPRGALVIADSPEVATSLYFEEIDKVRNNDFVWKQFDTTDEFVQHSDELDLNLKEAFVILNYANTRIGLTNEEGFVALKKVEDKTIPR